MGFLLWFLRGCGSARLCSPRQIGDLMGARTAYLRRLPGQPGPLATTPRISQLVSRPPRQLFVLSDHASCKRGLTTSNAAN